MKFLVLFRAIHTEFRVAEFFAVIARLRKSPEDACRKDVNLRPALKEINVPAEWSRKGQAGDAVHGDIFCMADLASMNEAAQVVQQCILVRAIFVPLGHGYSYATCLKSLKSPDITSACSDFLESGSSLSFKCSVEAFGRSYSMKEQLSRMEYFKDLFDRFSGPVRMKKPDAEFWILEDAFPALGREGTAPVGDPRQVFLGRLVGLGAASLGHRFSLKRRRYLGPTSTNAELSFVMANMAKVERGSVVMDPFCGTGSILVSCAEKGAVVVGSDLDMMVLRQKGGRSMDVNFEQYNLPIPIGILRADLLRSPYREGRAWVDAIVCDPPYGLREGARGFRDDGNCPRSEAYIPGTERVSFLDLLDGLLDFASKTIVPGGRLVFWLPTTPEYRDEDLPLNPGLRVISNCNQMLTMRMHRRLITMQRLTEADELSNQASSGVSLTDNVERPSATTHMPAHHDFSAKVLRQPSRSESRMKTRRHVSLQ